MSRSLLLLLSGASAYHSPEPADWSEIHPLAIKDLICALADPLPTIASIEVEGWRRSNRAFETPVRDGPWLRATDGRAWFQYRHVGATPGGIHVVETAESGGGSGIFSDLVFLRFQVDSFLDQEVVRRRVVLKCVGTYVLGDRDDGSYELRGSRLLIGASKHRRDPIIVQLE